MAAYITESCNQAEMAKSQTELDQLAQRIYEQLDFMDKNCMRLKSIADKVMEDSLPAKECPNTPPALLPYSPGILAGISGMLERFINLNKYNETQLSKLEKLI